MRSFNQLKALAFMMMAAVAVTGCGSTGSASRGPANTIGGSYMVAHFPGLPATGDRPAVQADTFGPDQFRQIQYLEQQCHAQLDRYIPNIAGELATAGLRSAIPTAVTTGLGAVASFTGVTFQQYAQYAGLSAGGSGIGGALGQRATAVRYVNYACVQGFVARASQRGELKGVVIVPWAGVNDARRMQMPTETVGGSGPRTPEPRNAAGEEESLPGPIPIP